jgi:hypothetical protein
MGFFSKYIPKEIRKPVGKAASKIIKPFQKFSDKFIPNEFRPYLPYASMLLPGSGILGAMGGPMGFAKMYGANMLTQAMGDPEAEFDELNQLSGILSGLQGGFSGPNTGDNLRGMTTQEKLLNDPSMLTKDGIMNQMASAPIGSSTLAEASGRGFLGGAKDLALNIGGVGSDYLKGNVETLQDLGSGRVPLNLENAKNAAYALAPDAIRATGDVATNFARPAIKKFEEQEAAELAEFDSTNKATDSNRASLQMTSMRQAGIPEDTVVETLEMNGLGEYYTPPTEEAAYGGLMGRNDYEFGGIIDAIKNIESREMMDQNKNMGGMMNGYNMGGSVLPQGMEMDYRQGGFIPMGSKERADDVPARVSKNEFVMTADAVRAAGGGSVNQGAKKMYDLMNNLEAKA